MKLICDKKLIREAEKFAGGEIHDVTNLITCYSSAAELFNASPKRYKKYLPLFEKHERILRVFVLTRKLNRTKTLKQIKKEWTEHRNGATRNAETPAE